MLETRTIRKPNLYLLWLVLALIIFSLSGLVGYLVYQSSIQKHRDLKVLSESIEAQSLKSVQSEVNAAADYILSENARLPPPLGAEQEKQLKARLARYIESIHLGQSGYISVLDLSGVIIAGQGISDFKGMHHFQLYESGDRNRFSSVFKRSASEGYIVNDWYGSDGTVITGQTLYLKPLPIWNWVLVAGVYQDPGLQILQQEYLWLSDSSGKTNIRLVVSLCLILLLAVIVLGVYARWIRSSFYIYQQDIYRQNEVLREQTRALQIRARIVEAAHEGIMLTDAKNRIIEVNRSFTRITGFEERDVLGMNPSVLSSGQHDKDFYKQMWEEVNLSGEWHGEIWNRRKNGTLYPQALSVTCYRDSEGNVENYIGTFTDISRRKAIEQELEHMAQSDSLTDLPNRRVLTDRMEHELAICRRQPNHKIAVLFLDLDLFKEVNDSFGHGVGDQVLITMARRLNEQVREIDLVCRLGGDEFVVLITEQERQMSDVAGRLAERIIEAVCRPITVAGEDLKISTSIGIAMAPDDGSKVDRLLEFADLALYEAKQKGRNRYRFYELWMSEARKSLGRHDART